MRKIVIIETHYEYFHSEFSLKFFVNLQFVYKIMTDDKKTGSEKNQNNSISENKIDNKEQVVKPTPEKTEKSTKKTSPKKKTPAKKVSSGSKKKEAPKKTSAKKKATKKEQVYSDQQDEQKEKNNVNKKEGNSPGFRSMVQPLTFFLCISLFSLFLIDILFSPNILSAELWNASMSVSELSMSKGLTGLDYFIHSMLKALLICIAAIFFLVVVTIKFILYVLLYVLFYALFNFLFIFITLCFIDRSDILLFLEDTKKVVLVFFDKIWEDEDMPKKYYANITLRANGCLVKLPDQTEEDFKKNVLLFDFYFIAQLVIFIGIPILYMIIVWYQPTRGKRKLASLKCLNF